MKNRLVAIIISLITLFTAVGSFGGITVYADTTEENPFADFSIMNLKTPSSFYDTANPTGTDENTPLLFLEESELLRFVQYNYSSSNSKSNISVYDKINDKTDTVNKNIATELVSTDLTSSNALYGLSYVQAVSFDPSKSGKKDHVAFVGVDANKKVKLVVYNSKNGKWSSAQTIGTMESWVEDGTDNYAMEPHLSITAGDYDGNYYDTVVVFAAVDGNECKYLYEFKVNSNDNDIIIKEYGSAQNRMLNEKYKDTKLDDKLLSSYTDKNGKNRLCGQVTTGDFDGDGKDDLAVMTWLNRGSVSGKGKLAYELYLPYLCIARGDAEGNSIVEHKYSGKYIYKDLKTDGNKVYGNSINGPGMTVGSFTVGGNDTLVIGGRSMTIRHEGGKSKDYDISEDYNAFAVASMDSAGSIFMSLYTGESIKDESNSLTTHTAKRNNETYPSSTLCAVAFDGPGTAEYLFMDGRIYSMTSGYPTKLSDFTKIGDWGDFGDVSYISGVAVGNIDGNEYGYEKIVFTLMEKNASSQDDYDVRTIQIYTSVRDSVSKAASVFACTINPDKDVDDKGDDLKEGVNGLVVAVDCDEDGLLARFSKAECVYTDPEILAILQAAPYFSDLYCIDFANLQNCGSTSLTISEKHGSAYGEEFSWNIKAGFSFSLNVPFNITTVQADYNNTITNGWEDSISYEVSEYFEATNIDQVIVYRTPIYVYTYAIYDSEAKKFDDNKNMVFYVQQKPSYVQMSITEYNDFAKYYNETMDDINKSLPESEQCKYSKLAEIGKLASLGNEGNPSGYNVMGTILGNGGTTSQSKSLGTAGGQEGSEINITSEYTDYSSDEHGFTLGVESVFGRSGKSVKFGANLGLEFNWKYTNKTTSGRSVKAAAYVGNIVSSAFEKKGYDKKATWESYGFTWDACIFSTEIDGKEIKLATGEYYKDTVTKVPIIGYVVYEQSVRSLPSPPKVENSIYEGYNQEGGYYALNLKWTPAENTADVKNYAILRYKNGAYIKVDTVSADTTTYEYRDRDEVAASYIFAIQPIVRRNGADVECLRSEMMYGYSTTTASTIIKAEYKGIKEEGGKTYYMYVLTQNDGTKIDNFWLISAGYCKGVLINQPTLTLLMNMDKAGGYTTLAEWEEAINAIHALNGHLITNEFSITVEPGQCIESKLSSCSLCGQLVVCSTTQINAHDCTETHITNICTGQSYTEKSCSKCHITVGTTFTNGEHVYKTVTVAPTCCSEGYDVHYCIACGDYYVDNTKSDSNAHEYVTTEYCVCENGVHRKYSRSICKYCGDVPKDTYIGEESEANTVETYRKVGIINKYISYVFSAKCGQIGIGAEQFEYKDIVGSELAIFKPKEISYVYRYTDKSGNTWYRVDFTVSKGGTGRSYEGWARFRIDQESNSGPMTITDVEGCITYIESPDVYQYGVTAEFLKILFAECDHEHIYEYGCYTDSTLSSQYKTCILCGHQETESHEHDYTTHVVGESQAEEGTLKKCKSTTIKTCWCGSCEKTESEHVHTWVEGSQATCTYAGKSTRFCTTCGEFEVIEDSESVTDPDVHHWVTKVVEPTCTEDGKTVCYCDFCNTVASETVNEGSATGHTPAADCDTVVAPTCTEDGYTKHICATCGETYTDTITTALGHNFVSAGAVVVAPTCSHEGYTVNYCTRCLTEAQYTNEVDPVPDNHTYIAETHNMTCTEKGYTVYTCQGCGDSYSLFFEDDENITDENGNRITEKDNTPSGHVQDESVTPVHHDATDTENGYTEYQCKTCGEKYVVYDKSSDDKTITILREKGIPSDSQGKEGFYYINTCTGTGSGDIYRKFADGWTLVGNVADLDLSIKDGKLKKATIIKQNDVDISFGDAVSDADIRQIIAARQKFSIKNLDDAVFDAVMSSLLMAAFSDMGITENDVEFFFANPNNTVEMWCKTNIEVVAAEIVGCEEPYMECSFTVQVNVRTTNASTGMVRAAKYTVKTGDYADGSEIDVTMPVFGALSVKEIIHTSEDGEEIYDVYTKNGNNKFVYDKNQGTVTVPVGHFSNIKIKFDAGANGENIVTGDSNNIWLYVLSMLAAALAIGFAAIRLRKRYCKR